MVRNFKPKRPKKDAAMMSMAVNEVLDGASTASTSDKYEIPRMTLSDHVRRRRTELAEAAGDGLIVGEAQTDKLHSRSIFTMKQEKELADYVKKCSEIYYGLSNIELRKLAFDCAVKFGIEIRPEWNEHGMAGLDWARGFRERHNLSIRKPQATSLARATAFNRHTCGLFFNTLSAKLQQLNVGPESIWCMDETGITTVHIPGGVIATKGVKQVGGITSGERGTLITVSVGVNAAGRAMPPLFIIPRVKIYDWMIHNCPPGSTVAGSKSGWSTEVVFLQFIRHFITYTKSSPENPQILILDQHQSHIHISVINAAKSAGIILIALPPHTTHRLMPLDQNPFKFLKNEVSKQAGYWMANHPGQTIKIYDIAGLVGASWPKAMSKAAIEQGFRVTGIYPFNPEVFTDRDFAPSYVSDRPLPEEKASQSPGCHEETPDAVTTVQNDIANAGPEASDAVSKTYELDQYLKHNRLKVTSVLGDGHCILYATSVSLRKCGVGEFTSDEVGRKLAMEICTNSSYYKQFVTSKSDIEAHILRYIFDKTYNNETCDLIINALSNVFKVNVNIIRATELTVEQLQIVPGRLGETDQSIKQTIYLIQSGSGTNIHYSAGHPEEQKFSPFEVRPLPKAGPRKQTQRERPRKRTCEVLTDTPVKDKIALEEGTRQEKKKPSTKKQPRKPIIGGKNRKKQPGKPRTCRKILSTSSSDEDDAYCALCGEQFSKDKPMAKWAQCEICRRWTHEMCADRRGLNFICINCDSDDDL